MRTLKKTLALVLCLAMIAGLCCFGTSAAFADAAEIEYTEAVAVMNGLGVLKGDGTNFNPKGILTRAEAAVMLAKLIGEGDIKSTSTFKDMKGYEWAQNYAAVCEAKGYILGDGKGNFFPGQTLTGYQFGLMLARAMGYKPAQEGVESATYEIGTAALMKKIKLSDAIEGFDGTAPLTREQAAALLLKAATLNTVTYGGGSYIEVDANAGTTTIRFNEEGVAGSTGTTLYATVFGGQTWSGVLTANAAQTAGLKYTTVNGKNFNIATGADLYGHYVTVYYKSEYQSTAKPGVAYAVVDKTVTVSGIAPTATAKDVEAAFIAAGFAPAGQYTFTNKYTNGGVDAQNAVAVTVGTTTGSTASLKTFYAYYDAANNVNVPYGYAVADTQVLARVTNINTKAGYETITLGQTVLQNNVVSDVVNEYAGIAIGDMVTYTVLNNVYNLSKVTTVEGKVTKAVLTQGLESLTLDGKTYKQGAAFAANVTLNAAGATSIALANVAVGQSYVLYLDAQGNFVSILGSAAAEAGVIYLTGKYSKTTATDYGTVTAYYAQGVDTTGAEISYQVTSTEYDKLCVAGQNNKPAKYLYNVTTAYDAQLKATVATLTAATTQQNGLVVVDNDRTVGAITALTTKKIGNDYFDANTLFIYVTGGVTNGVSDLKVSTKTGVQDTEADSYVYYAVKPTAVSTNSTIKYVFVDAAGSTATAGTGYIYVAANQTDNNVVAYTDVTGAPAVGYMIKGFVDGVETDIMVADGDAITTGFYKYTVEPANNLYTLASQAQAQNLYTGATLTNYYNGMLSASDDQAQVLFTDMKATDVVVVNAVAKTEANYAYISTDLATIVAENNDQDQHEYVVAIVTDTVSLPNAVTYVYVTAADVDAAD